MFRQRNGRTIKGLIDVARDGYLWFVDRSVVGRDGRMKFVEGKPFVNQNVFKSLDPETGKLKLLNQRSSLGAGPCHLVLDKEGRHLLVANYDSGSVAVLPVGSDG